MDNKTDPVADNKTDPPQTIGLVTIHRAENTNDITRLSNIVTGLDAVSKELLIIWPAHPRSKKLIDQLNFDVNNNRFRVRVE
ncbi:UDP-N-acetylglucosamine 2-epimerase [bacterium]|nr:UDP-N-acetylglucosamine 2-epimerase [bacterium]